MKKSVSRFCFVLVAFALGLASVQLVRYTDDSCRSSVEFEMENLTPTRALDFSGFRLINRDCTGVNKYGGDSCVSGYQNAAHEEVWEFAVSNKDKKSAEREISLRIADSLGIQSDSRVDLGAGQPPFRRLELITGTEQGTRTEIIRYDDKNKLDVISAVSADTAYEFEKWLNDRSANK